MVEDELVFFVNGKKVVEKIADPETTLLVYLRRKLGLKGTKLGCGAGGCGACTVMLSRFDRLQNKIVHSSANACLIPICALHHVAVTTVEGIGSTKTRLHPVQERISKSHGSQCGFCTPGIVMSMYTLLRNNPEPSMEEIENTFRGRFLNWRQGSLMKEGVQTVDMKMLTPLIPLFWQVTLLQSLFNPEEFMPLDPTQEPIFPPELLLRNAPRRQLCFQGERVRWIQVATLKELLDLKAQHPEAMLVVGNTKVGKRRLYPWSHKFGEPRGAAGPSGGTVSPFTGISFGASCTLSFMEETLASAVTKLPAHKTEVFQGILEQLRWFSGKQIKSVAVRAYAQALGCVWDQPLTIHLSVSVTQGPVPLLLLIENGTRRRIIQRLLGKSQKLGIKVHCCSVCHFLTFLGCHGMEPLPSIPPLGLSQVFPSLSPGRDWDESLLADVCAGLEEELRLAPDAPGGKVEFRRTLTLSFFFKFYLTVLLKLSKKSMRGVSCAWPGQSRDCPSPLETFPWMPRGQSEEDMVGRPLPHLAAAMQACGEAVYCDDIPLYSNELYLWLVTSTKAHARIKSIDTSEAQNVPGFECFLSADDIPGSNITGLFSDETVFAKDEVTCIGHIIGAVVADTPEHAQRAARAVKITYEELPAIISIEDALKEKSFHTGNFLLKIEKGDLQKGFADAEHILEGEVYIGGQKHFYLETHCTIAVPKGESGEMELFVGVFFPQRYVSKVLGVPPNRILVHVKRLGGGFGGKESRTTILSTVVAVAAHKTGRPIRCMLDRDEDMLVMGGRHPFMARYKVGFLKNGKVVALEIEYHSNAGNSIDLSKSIMESALFNMDNCYKIPNIRGTGKLCKTNLPSNTAFRGFGAPQGMFIAESWMSKIAVKCGRPPEEVRRLNMYEDGDLTHFNQKLEGFMVPRCWSECLENSQYHARRMEVETFNRENAWKKRGLAIIPTKFSISIGIPFLNQAGALVHVYTDGSVLLTHGGIEMGQGLHTKMIQVANRVLGIPMSKIYISETSTNTVPNTSATSASLGTDLNGMAVQAACKTILERLKPFKDQNPNGSWEDWVILFAQHCKISLYPFSLLSTPNLGYNFETNSGNRFNYFCYGVACSEVEIDCLTGDYQNIRTDIVMDVGTSLNPAIDIGQVEGGFVQGLGLFTLEELHYSPEGKLLTRGLDSYKIPACGDIPTKFHVTLLRDCPNQKAIFSSKAVGEPPLFLAASIFFAIKDAIGAARAQGSESQLDPLFQLDSPATPERIRNACVDRFTKLCGTEVPANFKPWCKRV
uniref:Xanthine dehydrogenase/oxidase n=1 Tax=Ornithorhynchus anatinus TaxID=9258 RepID=A0A6I8MZT9_ORNAN